MTDKMTQERIERIAQHRVTELDRRYFRTPRMTQQDWEIETRLIWAWADAELAKLEAEREEEADQMADYLEEQAGYRARDILFAGPETGEEG